MPNQQIESSWVLTDDDLAHLIERLQDAEEVIFDLETTGLDENAPGAKIVLAAFTVDPSGDTYILPAAHPDSPWLGTWRRTLRKCFETLRTSQIPLSNQNIKFDCRWVKVHTGVDLSKQIVWDTRISSHLLDENESTRLGDVAARTFGVETWKDFDFSKVRADEVNLIDLGIYGSRDTYWTWRLEKLHRRMMNLDPATRSEPETPDEVELARLGSLAIWVSMPTTATLTAMEQRGMVMDTEWVIERLKMSEEKAGEIYARLAKRYKPAHIEDVHHRFEAGEKMDIVAECRACRLAQDASFAPTSLWFKAWTAEAVDRGDLKVASLTPKGQPQWSKAVLIRQSRTGSEVAQDLLEYRKWTKQAEFLRSWLQQVSPDGTIHTTYNAGSVVTGRLSSSGPNMQQVTAALKPAFIPRPGYYIVELDYSQIELRVAAFISRCIAMIRAFQRGEDLHRLLAQRILQLGEDHRAKEEGRQPRQITLEEVTGDDRQKGKSANFGLLYMMSAYGFQMYAETVYDVSMTVEEAEVVHKAFFEMWDGMAQWHLNAVRRVQTTGQVVSPLGRVRRLPMIYDGNPERVADAERQAVNSPVQGMAADMTLTAASSIEGTLPGHEAVPDVMLIGTVHDSIIAEVPIHDWKRATARCMRRMIEVPEVLRKLGCDFDVPLAVEAKVGTRWGLSDVGVVA